MFLSDNETATDLLYVEAISKTVVRLIQDAGENPISIGVHGDWGAGKSSVLLMAEAALARDKTVACVRCNGWQLQGFQDAKTVVIEQIMTALEERVRLIPKATKTFRRILKRVNVLKVARKVAGLAVAAHTGVPVHSIGDVAAMATHAVAADPVAAVDAVEGVGECLSEAETQTLPKEMDAFRREFSQLLTETDISRLVVFLDDLDRCLPNTAIETLEAIKLFLFVPRAVFVIAADEGMIEYAVKQHFPDLNSVAGASLYARNYLEKLIQVPFRIPAMGLAETRVYVALVLLEANMTAQSQEFKIMRDAAREVLRKPWVSEVFDRAHLKAKFGRDLPTSVQEAITLSDQVAVMLAEQTKGNPRQVKRFLNALLLRHAIAAARGLQDEVKTAVLAKVMLAERFLPDLYEELAGQAASSDDGSAPMLIEMEETSSSAKKRKIDDNAGEQDAKQVVLRRTWATLQPPLAEEDLRPYILITRDQRNPFSVSSVKHAELLGRLLGSWVQVKGTAPAVKALDGGDAESLFDALVSRIRTEEKFSDLPEGAVGLSEIVRHHPLLQTRLVEFAKSLPVGALGGWPLGEAGWDGVLRDAQARTLWREVLGQWALQQDNKELQQTAKGVLLTLKKG